MEYPDEEFIYFQYAERFGWTPAQVDEINVPLADWLLAIAGIVEEVKIEKME